MVYYLYRRISQRNASLECQIFCDTEKKITENKVFGTKKYIKENHKPWKSSEESLKISDLLN